MKDSILKGARIGIIGLVTAILLFILIDTLELKKVQIIGVLGGVCWVVSVVVLILGMLLIIRKDIGLFLFLKSFLFISVVLALIGVWNLINAGWLTLPL